MKNSVVGAILPEKDVSLLANRRLSSTEISSFHFSTLINYFSPAREKFPLIKDSKDNSKKKIVR